MGNRVNWSEVQVQRKLREKRIMERAYKKAMKDLKESPKVTGIKRGASKYKNQVAKLTAIYTSKGKRIALPLIKTRQTKDEWLKRKAIDFLNWRDNH